jgi:ketosteroid isomerase-like protein
MAQRVDRGRAVDVVEIRRLIGTWAGSVRARDLDGIVDRHADDVVLFDVPPPVQSRGIDAYRQSWEEFFHWFGASGSFDVNDLEITAGDDVAFCHGLIRCAGADGDCPTTEPLNVRLSVGLVKVGGVWTVMHEHHSEPSAEPIRAVARGSRRRRPSRSRDRSP